MARWSVCVIKFLLREKANKMELCSDKGSEFCAIILAAGYSSRMDGRLKALLPLGLCNSMITMAIKSFQDADIYDIYVVLGHEHAQIENAIKDFNVHIVYNRDFQCGMFSSICAGLKSVLANNVLPKKAAFILPVDAPLVKSSTIKSLAARWAGFLDTKCITIPIFLENCGHPPLMGNAHFEAIINYEMQDLPNVHEAQSVQKGQGGLRGYFASLLSQDRAADFLRGIIPKENNSDNVKFIPIADEGIISDIDTMSEYEKAQNFLQTTCNRAHISLPEAYHLLQMADLTERITKHSAKVALGALRLGLVLKLNKLKEINLEYHICGGILHDICRLQRDHALKGKRFLYKLGYEDLAHIVGSHAILPKKLLESMQIYLHEENIECEPSLEDLKQESKFKLSPECLYACICVYLADKFFSSDKFVTMQERYSIVRKRFAVKPLVVAEIRQRELVGIAVGDWFYKETKIKAEACVQKASGHVLESQLNALFKI